MVVRRPARRHARLPDREPLADATCSSPPTGSTRRGAGAPRGRLDRRQPTLRGSERRIEAFLLDFEGDLYGTRLRSSSGRSCARSGPSRASRTSSTRSRATSRSRAPPPGPASPGDREAAAARVGGAAVTGDDTHSPEVVVELVPEADVVALVRQRLDRLAREARLEVDDRAGRVEPRAVDRLLGARGPRPGSPRAPAPKRGAAGCPRRLRRRARARSSSRATIGAIMLSIRLPASSGPMSRSDSPSMLFRWTSKPGRKSPEPRPRLVVTTQALPAGRRRRDSSCARTFGR